MTSQINGLNVAVRNANDGISMAQTAEGAMQESTNILQRMRDLAVQSANGSNSAKDRQSLQKEVSALTEELTRIAETTTFGGQNLLDGSFGSKSFQVGSESGQQISFTLDDMSADQLGGNYAKDDSAGSVFGGAATIAATPAAYGKTTTAQTLTITDSKGASTVELNDMTATEAASAINAAGTDVSAEANAEFSLSNIAAGLEGTLTIGQQDIAIVAADDINTLAEKINDAGYSAEVSGTQLNVTAYGVDGASITATAGDVGFSAGHTTVAANVDSGTVGDESGRIDSTIEFSSAKNFTLAGASEVTGLTSVNASEQKIGGSAGIDISTASGAKAALSIIDGAIETVDNQRADLGAIQNRFESTISNLTNISENVSAARSRIRDVDFAQETAKMSQNQILQQAGTTILAQANQLPQAALSLLG
jgi:flagellin